MAGHCYHYASRMVGWRVICKEQKGLWMYNKDGVNKENEMIIWFNIWELFHWDVRLITRSCKPFCHCKIRQKWQPSQSTQGLAVIRRYLALLHESLLTALNVNSVPLLTVSFDDCKPLHSLLLSFFSPLLSLSFLFTLSLSLYVYFLLLSVSTKIVGHVGHFRWLEPNVRWEIS